jgi:hypothetical protein
MKYLILTLILLSLNGCLYFGDEGVSTKLYNDCKEYYDGDGNYVKECPKNLVDYSELDN